MKIATIIELVIFLFYELFLFVLCKKEKNQRTNSKIFWGESLFFVGKYIGKRINIQKFIKFSRKKEQYLFELFDQADIGMIKTNLVNSKITYIFVLVPFSIFIGLISRKIKIFILLFFMVMALSFSSDYMINKQVKTRRYEIMNTYPSVLTKMSILVNAGIPIVDAFKRVANSGCGIFYMEMKNCVDSIDNGVPYDLAFENFSKKCGCREIRRFASLCTQNIVNGDTNIVLSLCELSNFAWNERKTRAKLASEQASELLLFPIILMFAGIMIMVIVPTFDSLI
ncbi:MAG: type II secretion system F family protein [Oscillospiraceae bacterium]|nr:type II secretion system F family protein [Oscillospiraceae bacterium]